MKKAIYALVILLVAIVAIGVALFVRHGNAPQGTACTLEAKLCPDGSYVGRTGPACEFAACPGASAASTTPAPAQGGQGILPYKSGVTGVVMLGPTCPVMRDPPDPQCADKPYQTMVVVFRKSDATHAFVIGKSGADGIFRFSLPPGDYILGAGESNLPRCDHPAVTVGPSGYASTTISCDTGIR